MDAHSLKQDIFRFIYFLARGTYQILNESCTMLVKAYASIFNKINKYTLKKFAHFLAKIFKVHFTLVNIVFLNFIFEYFNT